MSGCAGGSQRGSSNPWRARPFALTPAVWGTAERSPTRSVAWWTIMYRSTASTMLWSMLSALPQLGRHCRRLLATLRGWTNGAFSRELRMSGFVFQSQGLERHLGMQPAARFRLGLNSNKSGALTL